VRLIERLASFARCVWWDSWGLSSSDRLPIREARLVESAVDDMIGLLDAIGWERPVVLDVGGGWSGLQFAATHPERTRALVLDHPSARVRVADDYPEGLSEQQAERRLAGIWAGWGSAAMLRFLAPGMAGDERFVRWFARCERLACTPDYARWLFRGWYEMDLRALLPVINVPTLVLVRSRHHIAAQSKYVASHIQGGRVVELPGDLLFFAGLAEPMLDAIEDFTTGRLPDDEVNRALATVLFTDLVGSTEHAARMGDRRWRELQAAHDKLVRAELHRFRGREVKSMGDGFLVTFDGPGRAIRCACAITDAMRELGIEVRIGAHTGEVELQGDDIGGIAVHIAARVTDTARPGEVLVSSTVRDLVAGSGIHFDDRGTTELRGIPEAWRLFAAKA
jgi:class 3 adenylate cyclase